MNKHAVWVVSANWIGEAQRSVQSLKAVMPDVRTWLYANVQSNAFDVSIPWKARPRWYETMTSALNDFVASIPEGDRALFCDSDIYWCAPADDLYWLLHRFDIAAIHAPGRWTTFEDVDLPDCYCELNTGLTAFANNERVRSLFADWHQRILSQECESNDQGPLREAIWDHPDIRLWVLPPEYGLRYGFGCFIRGPVPAVHGRSPDYGKLCRLVNEGVPEMRTFRRGELE
jgi:hypothetical protein